MKLKNVRELLRLNLVRCAFNLKPSGRDGPAEPSLDEGPVAHDRAGRNGEHVGRLLNAQSAEDQTTARAENGGEAIGEATGSAGK